jgi:hypothetical protein
MIIAYPAPETASGLRPLHGDGCETEKERAAYAARLGCQLVPDDFDFGFRPNSDPEPDVSLNAAFDAWNREPIDSLKQAKTEGFKQVLAALMAGLDQS